MWGEEGERVGEGKLVGVEDYSAAMANIGGALLA